MLYFVMLPVGFQIYLRRLEQNLTQKELAQKAGIPQPNLSNIEKRKHDLTISTLRRIAVALDVPPRDFFEAKQDDAVSKLSRSKIETIAKSIASEAEGDDLVTRLFRNVIPHKGRVRVKELHRSWFELRKRFSPQEIASVYERVEEYKRRKP